MIIFKCTLCDARLDGESNTPQNFASVDNSQKLVLCRRLMEQRHLLVDKERVGHPDQLDVFGAHDEFVEARPPVER